MIIYKITNRVNGKIYIGQTTTPLLQRWRAHRNSKSNCVFHKAIRKYGAENFTVEQIDIAADCDELNKKEQYWIRHYNSMRPNGYNSTTGGDNTCACDEVKQKLSKQRMGANNHMYGRNMTGANNPFFGKKHTAETRKKLSEHAKQRTGSKNSFYGKSLTEKQKQAHYRPVMCVETGEVFECMRFACDKHNLDLSTLAKVCKGVKGYKSCKGLHWRFCNE